MKIILGRYMDGGSWPDAVTHFGGGRAAVDGVKICGPMGFLSLLEEKLGLPVRDTHGSIRIATWEKAMAERIAEANPSPFYAKSFEVDSWNTARRILDMRDELVLCGIMAKVSQSVQKPERLAEILRLEQMTAHDSGSSAVPGASDRFQLILRQLEGGWPFPHAESLSLDLLPARTLWDRPWQKLFRTLEKHGIRITEQAILSESSKSGTAEIHQLEGETLAEAAEALAAMLAARKADPRRCVIIRSADSLELDSALRRHCGASTGCRPRSTGRPYVNLISLYLRLHLLPFEPETLRQFLLLPLSPVDKETAQTFLRALNRCEAAGSRDPRFWPYKWRGELFCEGKALPEAEAAAGWLFPKTPPKDDNITGKDIRTLCSELKEWAWKAANDCPELAKTAELCTRMTDAAEKKKGLLTRLEFDKMLASVLGDGEKEGHREAMPWTVLTDPGQLFGPADTVIWWDFSDTGSALRDSVRWTKDELDWMGEDVSKNLDAQRKALELAWNAPFLFARKELILVTPRMKDGEPVGEHPALTSRKGLPVHKVDAAEVLGLSQGEELPALWTLEKQAAEPLPEANLWQEDAGRPHPLPTEVYPSTVENMLGCPAAWYFKNVLELKDTRFPLSAEQIQKGNVAHAVMEKVLLGDCPCTDEAIAAALLAEARRQAARLATDTAAHVRFDMARRLKKSLYLLQKKMKELHLRFADSEQSWRAPMPVEGMVCQGRYDVALGPEQGKEISHIVDLKWSSSGRYAEAAKKGLCVQLALYWHLLKNGEKLADYKALPNTSNHEIKDAWYLLLVSHDLIQVTEKASFDEQWETLVQKLEECRGDFESGLFRLAEKQKGKAPQGCSYCAYSSICGIEKSAEGE